MDFTADQKKALVSRGKSVAVSAAAGSGKTAVLTRRVTERIISGELDVSRVLIVTFTAAASRELVKRISAALEKELASDPGNRYLTRQILLLPTAKICTVHSFCLDIVRNNFQKIGIPSDFTVADETELGLLLNDTTERLIDDCFNDESVCGIDNFSFFADAFGSFGDGGALSDNLIGLYKKLSDKTLFIETVNECGKAYRDITDTTAEGFYMTPWGGELREYISSFSCYYKTVFARACGYISENEVFAPYLPAFEQMRDFCTEIEYANRNGYKKVGETLLSLKASTLSRKVSSLEITPEMSYYKDERTNFLKVLRTMYDTYFSYGDKTISEAVRISGKLLGQLYLFLKELHRRYTNEKNTRHIIGFSDMQRYALDILYDRESSGKSDIARALTEAFDEIYVDEYQDTDDVQDTIFRLVSNENNRFFVGDVKQSIYAFRGSSPDIFGRLSSDGGEHTENVYLHENFRSSPEILGFCNEVFVKLLNIDGKTGYGENEKLYTSKEKSGVKVKLYEITGDDGAEAEYVAKKIKELKDAGAEYSDIAVLSRYKKSFIKITEALKKHGIPFSSEKNDNFLTSPEILLVISLLNVIDNPSKDIYLAATLKSPIYGVTLDELIFIRKESTDGTLYDALVSYVKAHSFKKGEDFLRDLNYYREYEKIIGTERLIWNIYTDKRLFSLYTGDDGDITERHRDNLIQLYNLARGFEKGVYKGLYAFISYLDDIMDAGKELPSEGNDENGDFVTVTTVHKSKGLEYEYVFLFDTSRNYLRTDLTKRTLYDGVSSMALSVPAGDGMSRIRNPIYEILKLPLLSKLINDELRVLYVALTRAKRGLYVTHTGKASSSDNIVPCRVSSAYSVMKCASVNDLLICALRSRGDENFTYESIAYNADMPEEEAESVAVKAEKPADDEKYNCIKRKIYRNLGYKYPFELITAIPAKLSVSGLTEGALDRNDEALTLKDDTESTSKLSLYVPKFISEADNPEYATPAEKGIAMHSFMQFCDFDRVKEKGVRSEAEYLAENRFIFTSDIGKLNFYKLSEFFKSKIAARIYGAERVYRERRFTVNFPAPMFTQDGLKKEALEGESLLIQGIIDCVFVENGEYYLLDYKTDGFAAGTDRKEIEETLIQRHSRQIFYYRYACGKIFGHDIKEAYVYSFALGDTVIIPERGKE